MYKIVFNGGTTKMTMYHKDLWSNVVDAIIKTLMSAIKNRAGTTIDVYDDEDMCIVHVEC